MQLLDLTLPTPAENLALDEALLLECEAGRAGEVLRLWEWPRPAVVLGSGCRLAEDVDQEACRAEGVPVLRRSSGGGTVLLGPGCLLFSLVLLHSRDPALREISSSYEFILGAVARCLGRLVPGVRRAGTSDLAVGEHKFSGNAQQRKRLAILHHGTLLYDFDHAAVTRCLRVPARQPDYRRGRSHEAFLKNLPLDLPRLKGALRECWRADQPLTCWPAALVRRLCRERYADPAWAARR